MRVPARRPSGVSAALAVLCATGLAAAAAPASALTIIPHYDVSITSQANASAIEAAFNTVVRDYANSFANPVALNVNVSWGSVAGQALPSTAVGASVDNLYGYFSYAQLKSYLTAFATNNPADTALATAARNLPTTAPAGPTNYVIPASEAKALGLVSPTGSGTDGSIGFAGSASSYDFNPTDGVTTGKYDFEAVAAHELAEVMGRISGIDSTSPAWRTPFDLFRYTAPGAISYGYNDAAYFSINGGSTNLRSFNNSSSGGDRGDWLSTGTLMDVDNAFISTGRAYNLTAADLTSLDVLGWGGSNIGDTASAYPTKVAFSLISGVPEVGQWVLMIAGFGLTGATLRRHRALTPKPVRVRR